MFTLDTRMSDALAERPELRTLLPAFHPAFARLSHPVLGKVLPRLVRVREAARIAGVDPEAMLAVMNLPGPPASLSHPGPSAPHLDEPRPAWLDGMVRELDVRPALAEGGEPFGAIMGAVRTLGAGEVLRVLAPFEPAPLRRLLGDRGWESHVEWEGETCRASFWRPADGRPADGGGSKRDETEDLRGELAHRLVPSTGSPAGTMDQQGAVLDVRGLEPPMPMRLALAALDTPTNLPLRLRHQRVPALLFPRLTERGFTWTVEERPAEGDGEPEVWVTIRGA